MAPRCTVCAHKRRKDIDEALVVGSSVRDIARRFDISKDAAQRHRAHVSPALARVVEQRRQDAGPTSALDRLEDLYVRILRVLDTAEEAGQSSMSLSAARELRSTIEALAKITGELDERPTVNVLNLQTSSEWQALRGGVLAALAPYPGARDAVVRALAGQDSAPVVGGEVQ